MKLALILLARDKAKHVRRAALAALWQEGEPIEILLSNQGSTDGTREILAEIVAGYRGPHSVRLVDCPHTDDRGMAGFNAHLAWAIGQTSADWVVALSADDFALTDHAARLAAAIDAHPEADMVAMAQLIVEPGAEAACEHRTGWQGSGFVSVADVVEHKVGGSTAQAWKRSLWEKAGPVPGIVGLDVYLPPIAAALGGFWFEDYISYVYVSHADVHNMGLGGVLAAQEDPSERLATVEQINYQVGNGWRMALRKLTEIGAGTREQRDALAAAAWKRFTAWADTRTEMTLRRVPPKAFPI